MSRELLIAPEWSGLFDSLEKGSSKSVGGADDENVVESLKELKEMMLVYVMKQEPLSVSTGGDEVEPSK